MSERYIVRYLKFEFGAACKCRTYAKKSQVICSSSALVSYAFLQSDDARLTCMTLPQLYIPSDKLLQAVANYNRVEVFMTSRVASMLPCSSCVCIPVTMTLAIPEH